MCTHSPKGRDKLLAPQSCNSTSKTGTVRRDSTPIACEIRPTKGHLGLAMTSHPDFAKAERIHAPA
eukprot:scaffold275742_cov33-Tisochrysis_lutea.AAC.4